MQLICMDLVGPISPVTSRGNCFMLTSIYMLTVFTVAVPIKDKAASTICDVYRAHIYCTFGGSAKILTDNGTEFKKKQMDELCKQLNIKSVYSPVYTPESNSRLEALAAAAYTFFPCQTSGESPLVLMFGRDPITGWEQLIGTWLI